MFSLVKAESNKNKEHFYKLATHHMNTYKLLFTVRRKALKTGFPLIFIVSYVT